MASNNKKKKLKNSYCVSSELKNKYISVYKNKIMKSYSKIKAIEIIDKNLETNEGAIEMNNN